MSCQIQRLFYPALSFWFSLTMEDWTWTRASKKGSHFNPPQPSLCFLKPIIKMTEERISTGSHCRTVHKIPITQYKKKKKIYKLKFKTAMEPHFTATKLSQWQKVVKRMLSMTCCLLKTGKAIHHVARFWAEKGYNVQRFSSSPSGRAHTFFPFLPSTPLSLNEKTHLSMCNVLRGQWKQIAIYHANL